MKSLKIPDFIELFFRTGRLSLDAGGFISVSALNIANFITSGTLNLTSAQLKRLSHTFAEIESWSEALENSAGAVGDARENVKETFHQADLNVKIAFRKANSSLENAKDSVKEAVYGNKVLSSILGSSHHNMISLSHVRLSLRDLRKDISPEDVVKNFRESAGHSPVLYVPGLLCDETLWQDSRIETPGAEMFSPGLADDMARSGFYPIHMRYNQGLHISENGKMMADLLRKLLPFFNDGELNIISYSQGGLVLRSALYYMLGEPELRKKIAKVIFISSPDNGSYLEKFGYWLGFLLQFYPNTAVRLLGVTGNLRSDGIKDLSHGNIREEDWKEHQVSRYFRENYFGELDDIDAYQIASLIYEDDDPLSLVGDGIIERPSVLYLRDRVYLKKRGELRSLILSGYNHFSVMNSPELKSWILRILESRS